MGRGSGQTNVLYGPLAARTQEPVLGWEKCFGDGGVEYFDQFGNLYKAVVPQGSPWKAVGAQFNDSGYTVYLKDGKAHREDGPALEFENGQLEYWLDGQQHREDGPALITTEGIESWFRHGKLHREDGPAVDWKGTEGFENEYYLDGESYGSKELWEKAVRKRNAISAVAFA